MWLDRAEPPTRYIALMFPLELAQVLRMFMPASFKLIGLAATQLIQPLLDELSMRGALCFDRQADVYEVGISLTVPAEEGRHFLEHLHVLVIKPSKAARIDRESATCIHGHREPLQELGRGIVAIHENAPGKPRRVIRSSASSLSIQEWVNAGGRRAVLKCVTHFPGSLPNGIQFHDFASATARSPL